MEQSIAIYETTRAEQGKWRANPCKRVSAKKDRCEYKHFNHCFFITWDNKIRHCETLSFSSCTESRKAATIHLMRLLTFHLLVSPWPAYFRDLVQTWTFTPWEVNEPCDKSLDVPSNPTGNGTKGELTLKPRGKIYPFPMYWNTKL